LEVLKVSPFSFGVLMSRVTLLLERIQREAEPELKPMSEERMAQQDARANLIIRNVENRRLIEEAKIGTLETVKSLKADLKLISHVLKCKNCMFELILDVERYGGSHSGISSLDLNNNDLLELYVDDEEKEDIEMDLDPELLKLWRQIPRASDYRIGNYWLQLKGESNFETEKFIRDRLEWHKKILLYQLKQAREYYRMLLAWNVDEDPPTPYYRIL
jgi:hypothetical protein